MVDHRNHHNQNQQQTNRYFGFKENRPINSRQALTPLAEGNYSSKEEGQSMYLELAKASGTKVFHCTTRDACNLATKS
jgi:hypothetical protein